jgi:hypothetical protein
MKVYGFLLMVLLLGLAFVADLLTYLTVGGDLFVTGLFLLGVCLVFGVFAYGTWLSRMFSMVLFGITLLTGVILFPTLFPGNKELVALLLIVGSLGFVMSLMERCKGKRRRKVAEVPMPLPIEPMFQQATPAMQSLAVMESLDKDSEFLELDEVDKLVQKKVGVEPRKTIRRKATRKKPVKRKVKRKTRRRRR